jgi:pimeloyl-ACP methyl ester carboxylesterase
MAGEFDIMTREHTNQLARAIPGGREVIIEGGTHTALFDEPGIVNAHILRFLMADRELRYEDVSIPEDLQRCQ